LFFLFFFVIFYGLPSIKLTLGSWQGSPVSKVNMGSLLFFLFFFKIDLFQTFFSAFFFLWDYLNIMPMKMKFSSLPNLIGIFLFFLTVSPYNIICSIIWIDSGLVLKKYISNIMPYISPNKIRNTCQSKNPKIIRKENPKSIRKIM